MSSRHKTKLAIWVAKAAPTVPGSMDFSKAVKIPIAVVEPIASAGASDKIHIKNSASGSAWPTHCQRSGHDSFGDGLESVAWEGRAAVRPVADLHLVCTLDCTPTTAPNHKI